MKNAGNGISIWALSPWLLCNLIWHVLMRNIALFLFVTTIADDTGPMFPEAERMSAIIRLTSVLLVVSTLGWSLPRLTSGRRNLVSLAGAVILCLFSLGVCFHAFLITEGMVNHYFMRELTDT